MRLIIFDMDGTLINSGTSITNTINHVREIIGLEKMQKAFILEKVNDPNINAADFFYGTKEFTKEQKILFEKHYHDNCLKDLELYEGIQKLIDDLKSDFTLTVATNSHSSFAKKMLNHVGLDRYFKTILGYDSVKNAKPHPEMVHKILDTHQIKKENAQVIGDSHKDIMAAQKAGVDSLLVNWGFSNHKENAIENVEELKIKIFEKFN